MIHNGTYNGYEWRYRHFVFHFITSILSLCILHIKRCHAAWIFLSCAHFPLQNPTALGEHGNERSPVEHDSLMQSDEASDVSRKTWTASSQRSSRHMEDEYSDAYTDLYQPHRNHNSGLHSTNGHDSQDRLLERDSEHNHNERNWQRNRPWAKDSY